jgi:hypothetical protein
LKSTDIKVGMELFYINSGVRKGVVKSFKTMVVFESGVRRGITGVYAYESEVIEAIVTNFTEMVKYSHAFGSVLEMRDTLNFLYEKNPEYFI